MQNLRSMKYYNQIVFTIKNDNKKYNFHCSCPWICNYYWRRFWKSWWCEGFFMWNFKFKSSRHYPMGCWWTDCSVDFYNYSKFLLFSNHTEIRIRIVCSTISQFCTPDPSLLKIFWFLFVCGKKSIMFLFFFRTLL